MKPLYRNKSAKRKNIQEIKKISKNKAPLFKEVIAKKRPVSQRKIKSNQNKIKKFPVLIYNADYFNNNENNAIRQVIYVNNINMKNNYNKNINVFVPRENYKNINMNNNYKNNKNYKVKKSPINNIKSNYNKKQYFTKSNINYEPNIINNEYNNYNNNNRFYSGHNNYNKNIYNIKSNNYNNNNYFHRDNNRNNFNNINNNNNNYDNKNDFFYINNNINNNFNNNYNNNNFNNNELNNFNNHNLPNFIINRKDIKYNRNILYDPEEDNNQYLNYIPNQNIIDDNDLHNNNSSLEESENVYHDNQPLDNNPSITGSLISIRDSVFFCPKEKDIMEKLSENEINDLSKLREGNKRCTICLEDFKLKDIVIYLPCFHSFHKNCILNWLKNNTTCPLCKIDVNDNLQ